MSSVHAARPVRVVRPGSTLTTRARCTCSDRRVRSLCASESASSTRSQVRSVNTRRSRRCDVAPDLKASSRTRTLHAVPAGKPAAARTARTPPDRRSRGGASRGLDVLAYRTRRARAGTAATRADPCRAALISRRETTRSRAFRRNVERVEDGRRGAAGPWSPRRIGTARARLSLPHDRIDGCGHRVGLILGSAELTTFARQSMMPTTLPRALRRHRAGGGLGARGEPHHGLVRARISTWVSRRSAPRVADGGKHQLEVLHTRGSARRGSRTRQL